MYVPVFHETQSERPQIFTEICIIDIQISKPVLLQLSYQERDVCRKEDHCGGRRDGSPGNYEA
jgi:hypothetical protein